MKCKREYSIDFIKVIATIIIIFHHYQQVMRVYFSSGINFHGGRFYFGNIVELFFLVSGYLMFSYIPIIEQGMTLKEFYIKRFIRIFPIMAMGAVGYEILLSLYEYLFQIDWFDIKPTFWGGGSCFIGDSRRLGVG